MAKRKKPDAPTQGTLFGPADVCGGAQIDWDKVRERQSRGLEDDGSTGNGGPLGPPPLLPSAPRWDHGLTPPTPGELAALRAAHPGVMLLFRHRGGCAFHGDDTPVALGLLSVSPGGPPDRPWVGWPHADFGRHMRRLLAAGRRVAVVERGEGLPAGHRLCDPVVTPLAEVPGEDTPDA